MAYKENRERINPMYEERLELVMERILGIAKEPGAKAPFCIFFRQGAEYLLSAYEIASTAEREDADALSGVRGALYNEILYHERMKGAYQTCYGNPSYAAEVFGGEYGRIFCVFYDRLHSFAQELYEGCIESLCIYAELFVEIYNLMEEEDASPQRVREHICSFMHDYSEVFHERSVSRLVDPDDDYVKSICCGADISNSDYLYRYGLYVSENETKIHAFLQSFSDEEIQAMADTYTEGYRIGFEMTGKDLSKKTTAEIRYPIGFERMVRASVHNMEKLGLRCTFRPYSTSANKQYDFDHREDAALWLDKAYVKRSLETQRAAFEKNKELAKGYAGPAVIEVFGEEPFSPENKKEQMRFDEKQQELVVYQKSQSSQIMSEYIIEEERSFTIIAYPLPAIGEKFEEIFAETVKINTLDYMQYRNIQQKIIDVLDTADRVHIVGAGGNKTDLYVKIFALFDPKTETAFENCVADVNIPVGEVFTSPVLKGTEGKLFVSQVYLNELNYENLELDFEDGRIVSYTCTNFEEESFNRKYIKDNVLMHHETLPMGEFAIGTNTLAYRMARVYHIEDKLPILIAEKTGPHFAVGDTCYTYEEDIVTYNPDGKKIVARENEISALRREDRAKAYFNCHTDITIPYDELGAITVIRRDGSTEDIIRDGRFVLPGTEELNRPLEDLQK